MRKVYVFCKEVVGKLVLKQAIGDFKWLRGRVRIETIIDTKGRCNDE